MPKISYFLYSETHVFDNTPGGQKSHIIGPQVAFSPAFIPSMFSFAVNFSVLDIDLDAQTNMHLGFFSPEENEKPLVVADLPIHPIVPDETRKLPKDMQGIMIGIDLRNVALKVEGYYRTEISINGQLLGSFPVYIQAKESK